MAVEIWVIAESIEGQISDLSKEMIGFAKQAAVGCGGQLAAVVFGLLSEEQAEEFSRRGVDKIYLQEHPALADGHLALTLPLAKELVEKYQPLLICTGMTANGRDLAAGLSAELALPYLPAAFAVSLEREDQLTVKTFVNQGLSQQRVLLSGQGPVILGIASGTRGIEAPGGKGNLQICRETVDLPADGLVKHQQTYLAGLDEIDLTEADVVICGGNGMGDEASFQILHALGEAIGAPVGGSRAALDKGWVPAERMIGATGKNLRSNLYLAFGVSGAIQHLIGVKDCGRIIAVNTNPQAEIFQAADLAVVGDAKEILPLLVQGLADYSPIKETGLRNDESREAL